MNVRRRDIEHYLAIGKSREDIEMIGIGELAIDGDEDAIERIAEWLEHDVWEDE